MGGKRKAGGSDGLAVAAVRWFGSAALGPHSAICASLCFVITGVWAWPGMALTDDLRTVPSSRLVVTYVSVNANSTIGVHLEAHCCHRSYSY